MSTIKDSYAMEAWRSSYTVEVWKVPTSWKCGKGFIKRNVFEDYPKVKSV